MEGMENQIIRRRLAAKEKKISEVVKEDIRVRIFGTVIEKADSLLIDDGSGRLEVLFDEAPAAEVGEKVRVIARILPLADGFEARGEVLQKMEGFDFDAYKKAREILNSI